MTSAVLQKNMCILCDKSLDDADKIRINSIPEQWLKNSIKERLQTLRLLIEKNIEIYNLKFIHSDCLSGHRKRIINKGK